MSSQILTVPFAESLLDRVAHDLLDRARSLPGEDPARVVVLLPSQRACRTLENRLLELSGRPALLLPRILTDGQWSREAAYLLGRPPGELPADRLRPLILASRLADLPWLEDRPESAPGLAAEFIALFDQVRLERRIRFLETGVVGREGDPAPDWSLPAEGATAEEQGRRIAEVWRLYRGLVPRDRIDEMAAVAAALDDPQTRAVLPGWPLVIAAGYGRLSRAQAAVVRAALERARESRIYLPALQGPLDEAFAATWPPTAGEEPGGTDPLGPARRVRRRLLGADEEQPQTGKPETEVPTLGRRLAALGPVTGVLAPEGPLELVPCGDPETESLLVADRVVRFLAETRGNGRLAGATPDPRLGRRIAAQLRDAGVEVDQTLGEPLSALPAGLLARFILRAAVTDLRAEPLLEVLTHPLVALPTRGGRHAVWTLRLEGIFRRDEGPQAGLAGLADQAARHDRIAADLFGPQEQGLSDFIAAIAAAFAPLLALRERGRRPWTEHLAALRAVWRSLTDGAGDRDEDPEPRQDLAALLGLWDELDQDATRLADTTLPEFAADLGRLLAAVDVAPHRVRGLPVLVTGLVEARLERFDHLILAGLRDGAFPSRPDPGHLLIPGATVRLGLPGWRERLGLEAELFLRLLHNGGRVTVTWATEEDGQPQLPGSFVSRLQLALGLGDRLPDCEGPAPVLWRRAGPDLEEIAGRQEAFANSRRPVAVTAEVRPQSLLSWSALRQWRDCPYRFLVERRYAVTPDEELRREFSRLDYGNLVHAALADFLAPGGPGWPAVRDGRAAEARDLLEDAARRHFAVDTDLLPARRLWLDSFRRAMPAIVATEIERARTWQPVLLEHGFEIELPELAAWLLERAEAEGFDLCAETGLAADRLREIGARGAGIILRGTIDRIDAAVDDPGLLAVLDYKTGKPPAPARVKNLEELQVVLYAAALETVGVRPGETQKRVGQAAYYQIAEGSSGPPANLHLDGMTEAGRALLLTGTARLLEMAAAAADPGSPHPLLPQEAQGAVGSTLPCRFCDLRGVCRLEEIPRAELPAATWRKLGRLIHDRKGWL